MKKKTFHPKKLTNIEIGHMRFTVSDPYKYWVENSYKELRCGQCGQPLTVQFGARNDPTLSHQDPRWWTPTAVTCVCISPRVVVIRRLHWIRPNKRQDPSQLPLAF